MAKEKGKELELTPEQKSLAEAMDMTSWGAAPGTDKDLVIPRLLLMQPGSEQVTEGNAAFGEFRDSLTNKKVGDLKNAFEIIPITMQNIWVEYDVNTVDSAGNVEKKFLRTFAVTPDNKNLPYADTETLESGVKIKISRDYVQQYFVLLPEEMKSGNAGVPYIVSFRRSALKFGKRLYAQMYVLNRDAGLPPPGRILKMYARKDSNAKGTWAMPDVILEPDSIRTTPPEMVAKAFEWYKMINSNKVKIDDESLVKEEEVTTVTESYSPPPTQGAPAAGPGKF